MYEQVLNLEFYKGEDLYSDGDVEEEILKICESGRPLVEVLMEGQDWPILYHLSDIRENILDWYDFNPDASLLEIGAGCGALTGLFCRAVKKVVGVDLSKRRCTINATRNGAKGNLELLVGNFEDIDFHEQYDYVTLIGVLEYSGYYISDSDNPYRTMLKKVKSLLKPGGKLFIAIENKFGLKYFAGASEDHTGGIFDGIANYQKGEKVYTFSRPEISVLLGSVGFSHNEFYYPMPDYKLPKMIYSDKHLPAPGTLKYHTGAFDRERFHFFDERITYDRLIKDGQFAYFANSFLIISEV